MIGPLTIEAVDEICAARTRSILHAIRVLRNCTNVGLKEGKDFFDRYPHDSDLRTALLRIADIPVGQAGSTTGNQYFKISVEKSFGKLADLRPLVGNVILSGGQRPDPQEFGEFLAALTRQVFPTADMAEISVFQAALYTAYYPD